MNGPTIGIVVPAYNPDISTLGDYINDIRREINPELVHIEIDTPRPDNINYLRDIADRVSVSSSRRGKGGAIMNGFDTLETDILSFADADGSVPAQSLSDIIQYVRDGTVDVSIGSRRHPSSQIINHQTVIRRFLGNAFAYTAQKVLATQCRDYQCGAKAVNAEAWDSIGDHCYESGFAWDLEFLSVAGSLGYEIAEVPVTWKDHPDSTVDPIRTSVELATALIDVKRRSKAIATSPRYHDITKTDNSNLMDPSENRD